MNDQLGAHGVAIKRSLDLGKKYLGRLRENPLALKRVVEAANKVMPPEGTNNFMPSDAAATVTSEVSAMLPAGEPLFTGSRLHELSEVASVVATSGGQPLLSSADVVVASLISTAGLTGSAAAAVPLIITSEVATAAQLILGLGGL